MFGTFRKHSQPLWIAIIIVIVISFVVFFTPDFDPFDTSGTITADAAAVEQARNQILLNEVIEGYCGFKADEGGGDMVKHWPMLDLFEGGKGV